MYLAKTKNGNVVCSTVEELKAIPKTEITELYSLTSVDYDEVISNAIIRNCIYKYLKGNQYPKADVIEFVADSLDLRRAEVSKVISVMKKEKIIRTVKTENSFYGCLEIN